MTNFEKVLEFNKAFGVQNNTSVQLNIFDNNPSLINYRLSLINEEVNELREAIETKDFVETVDALSDIMYVVLGAFTALGIDADKAFDLVHKSNMSKLCNTEQNAIETVLKYKLEIPNRYDSPCYRQSEDGINWVVYNKSTMKILKSKTYSPVLFDSLF